MSPKTSIHLKLLQLANALTPILVIFYVISVSARHPLKASSSTYNNSYAYTKTKELQPSNAFLPTNKVHEIKQNLNKN
jgi:hypothetical protein